MLVAVEEEERVAVAVEDVLGVSVAVDEDVRVDVGLGVQVCDDVTVNVGDRVKVALVVAVDVVVDEAVVVGVVVGYGGGCTANARMGPAKPPCTSNAGSASSSPGNRVCTKVASAMARLQRAVAVPLSGAAS